MKKIVVAVVCCVGIGFLRFVYAAELSTSQMTKPANKIVEKTAVLSLTCKSWNETRKDKDGELGFDKSNSKPIVKSIKAYVVAVYVHGMLDATNAKWDQKLVTKLDTACVKNVKQKLKDALIFK